MWFKRMIIEKESPEQFGYDLIKYNLTESSTTDKTLADLGVRLSEDMPLCYGDHYGLLPLRQLIARRYEAEPDDVIVTVGACMALFLVYSTLLRPGDQVVVMHPNYPANVEIPRSLGCDVRLCRLDFDNGFRLDVDALIAMLTPQTRLVNITYPHNPTGAMLPPQDLVRLSEACAKNGTYLMVDETYGDLTVGERLPHACNLSEYGICIESLSKAIGAPGIRTGWVVTRNRALGEALIAAKEQICICGSTLDEECARQILENNDTLMAQVRRNIDKRFAIVCDILGNQDVLEWVRPAGGVVCFPRIRPDIQLDTDEFYRVLNQKYGVYVGPGRWFDMDDRYFRVGFGWPEPEALRHGLTGIVSAVREVGRC